MTARPGSVLASWRVGWVACTNSGTFTWTAGPIVARSLWTPVSALASAPPAEECSFRIPVSRRKLRLRGLHFGPLSPISTHINSVDTAFGSENHPLPPCALTILASNTAAHTIAAIVTDAHAQQVVTVGGPTAGWLHLDVPIPPETAGLYAVTRQAATVTWTVPTNVTTFTGTRGYYEQVCHALLDDPD